MEFRDRLKELRQKKGISQEALAKAIYVSRSAVAKWENGLGLPSDGNLQALCDYFGVEEDWLLDRQDLKKQITLDKRQATVLIVALLGIMTVIIYVLLGFLLEFHERINISMYYPPISVFEYVIHGFTYHGASNAVAMGLLCVSAAVWTIHTVFALSSVLIPALKKHFWVCLWGNIGFILLSAGLYLLLFFVIIQDALPVYELQW